MASINLNELVKSIQTAATGVIGRDVTKIQGFAQDQVQRIGKLGVKLAEMIALGEFEDDPEGQQSFLDIMKDLITNFGKTLVGLAIITIEKVINAVVKVVWDSLDKATGLALPRP